MIYTKKELINKTGLSEDNLVFMIINTDRYYTNIDDSGKYGELTVCATTEWYINDIFMSYFIKYCDERDNLEELAASLRIYQREIHAEVSNL
jgi:hypothetical protein